MTARKKDKWKAVTHKVLWPSVDAIRTQFGIAAWCVAMDTERRCHKALVAKNRSCPEPDIFLDYFVGFSKRLSLLVRGAFDRVFEIATKNRVKFGPVEWTSSQLTFMLEDKLRLSGEASRVRDWVAYACDGCYLTREPAYEDEAVVRANVPVRSFVSPARDQVCDLWLAPLWLRTYPYDPNTAWNRASEERTKRILKEQSYMLAGLLQRELKKLAERAHHHRAVTPIEPTGAAETATNAESREKPFKLPPRQGRNRLLEESEGALTKKQYRALDLKTNYKLTHTDTGREMGISRQAATKLLAAANRRMTNFLEHRKARLREPREGPK